ncbi:MAG: dephospho-CoA kinase, partial [Gammaproteobacteria bacterium]|nr:dephospho-CoA kinase [Gammaproteobacteria bacterium]
MRVGLTGGIACGKSTVANMFSELGVAVIDTDVIARDVVQPGEPALQKLVEAFGAEILNDQNRLDRRRMRERVFADENERRKLESILH